MDDESASRYREVEARFWRESGAEPRERWVEVPAHGIRVRVLELGDGPPLLFVHGITTAGSAWATLASILRGHRCLVLDRPGCGLSEALPADRVASFEALVDVQLAVLDALGVVSADVVGSSLGGGCALSLAASAPERVRRIVLDGAPSIAGIRPTFALRMLASGPIGRYLAHRRVSVREIRWSFGQWGHRKLLATGWPRGATLDWALAVVNETDTPANEVRVLQGLSSWHGFRTARLVDPRLLPGIHHPTLWLWGSDDPIATADQGRAWAAAMPSAAFVLLDAGHVPWLDEPDENARRIEAFLGSADQSPSVAQRVEVSA